VLGGSTRCGAEDPGPMANMKIARNRCSRRSSGRRQAAAARYGSARSPLGQIRRLRSDQGWLEKAREFERSRPRGDTARSPHQGRLQRRALVGKLRVGGAYMTGSRAANPDLSRCRRQALDIQTRPRGRGDTSRRAFPMGSTTRLLQHDRYVARTLKRSKHTLIERSSCDDRRVRVSSGLAGPRSSRCWRSRSSCGHVPVMAAFGSRSIRGQLCGLVLAIGWWSTTDHRGRERREITQSRAPILRRPGSDERRSPRRS